MAVTHDADLVPLSPIERHVLALALEVALHGDTLAANIQGRAPSLEAEHRAIVLELRDRLRA